MGHGRVDQHSGGQRGGSEAGSGAVVGGGDHRGAGGAALLGLGPRLELGTADPGAGRGSEGAPALAGRHGTPARGLSPAEDGLGGLHGDGGCRTVY